MAVRVNRRPFEADWKPLVRKRMLEQVVDDELVVLDPDRGQVYVLNTLGAAIYDLCDGRTTVREIVAVLKRHMPASDGDIADETGRFLAEMLEKDILD